MSLNSYSSLKVTAAFESVVMWIEKKICWKLGDFQKFVLIKLWTQSLILHKMLKFTGILNLSRFRKTWDVVVTNEFHKVQKEI